MSGAGIDSFMSRLFTASGDLLDASFELDFAPLKFIEPTGVASLANAVEYAMARACPVTFKVGRPGAPAVAYLDDSGFFKYYAGKYLNPSASLRGTTSPLERVTHIDSYSWIENEFESWLAYQLGREPGEATSIVTCMKEVFNNIQDHSGIVIGCTHMQHFPNRNEVVIAVCDFGVGIPVAIRRRYPELSDAEAIHHASQDGVTSGTDLNRGVGLDLLVKLVVGRNRGTVHIHSGHGKLACKMAGKAQVRKPWQSTAFYPGTMIEIRLKTNTFVPDALERESLEW
jgi:hypothetical protein